MPRPHHVIIIGRTSEAIAQGILEHLGKNYTAAKRHVDRESLSGQFLKHAPRDCEEQALTINRVGNVIQSRFGTFGDGEAIFELFVDGKLPDHPLAQSLTEKDKRKIVKRLKGAHVSIVHSLSGENTSSRAISLLHGIDYLIDELGVEKVNVVAPHLPFMRNDRDFRKITVAPDGREHIFHQYNAVSCDLYARQLAMTGISNIAGFEPHSQNGVKAYRKRLGKKNVTFNNMGDFFALAVARDFEAVRDGKPMIAVGAPDGLNKPHDYGIARAKSFGMALFKDTAFDGYAHKNHIRDIPYMFGIHKKRIDDKRTEIVEFHGDVQGKTCFLIDDIISSGGTTIDAANVLKKNGACHVVAIATHAVLVGNALQKLLESPAIDRLMLTDTIPGALTKAKELGYENHPKLVITTVAPLVIADLARFHRLEIDQPRITRQIMNADMDLRPV